MKPPAESACSAAREAAVMKPACRERVLRSERGRSDEAACRERVLRSERGRRAERSCTVTREWAPLSEAGESSQTAKKTQHVQNSK